MSDADPRLAIGGNLPPVDPENLIPISPEEIADILRTNYPGLYQRRDELREGADRWLAQHRVGVRVVIADDQDNNRTSDFLRQIATFIGPKGDVQEVFEKVKRPIVAAGKAVDGWKADLRTTLEDDAEQIKQAQLAYMTEKAARERREREAAARAEREAAARAEREAREALAQEEAARKLAAEGQISAAAVEAVAADTDRALTEATAAAERAEAVAAAADAPLADIVRSRSALGTTTTLRTTYAYEVEDIVALCAAVAAGKIAPNFVMPNDAVIRAALKGPHGLRECPGLRIFEQASVMRRGA